ncbi:hypothetical protein INT44_004728 [Umbelopsis vinacea]|uniref:Uncharacterized protein n=1 Tax=Umbelopsis vinacea TaxID=44442 RepID=A0A8H7U951_9FUNG|nr:hypothetical protein INT44_004728 [Umbelopsis vinacea]
MAGRPAAARPKQSYAAIAQKLVASKPDANLDAAKSALAFFHQKRVPHKSTTEQQLALDASTSTAFLALATRTSSLACKQAMMPSILNIRPKALLM